ncbi:hypothetical protein [Acetitomaculum ruminis]|nr:hypothetical protein [Acetitomaculum ruminis]
MFEISFTHDQVKWRFLNEKVLIITLALFIISGILQAFFAFDFLLKKRETTMFLSLGITRKRMFLNRSLAGVIYLLISAFLPMCISLFLNKMAVGLYEKEVVTCLYLSGGFFLVELLAFFITSVGIFISGTYLEAFVYGMGLMSLPTALTFSLGSFLNGLCLGNAYGRKNYFGEYVTGKSFIKMFFKASPLTFFYDELCKHYTFVRPNKSPIPPGINIKILTVWIFVLVLIVFLAFIIFEKRKAEHAGIMGKTGILPDIYLNMAAVIIFAVSLKIFGDFGLVFVFVSATITALLAHLFLKKIMFGCDLKIKNTCISFGIGMSFVTAIFILFLNLPGIIYGNLSSKEIESARVSYIGSPDYIYGKALGSSINKTNYILNEISFENKEEIKKLLLIQKKFIESGNLSFKTDKKHFENTVVPVDLVFSYKDKKGKISTFYYDRANMSELEEMLNLDDTKTVREKQSQVILGDDLGSESVTWAQNAYQKGEVYLCDKFFENSYSLNLNDKTRKMLLKAINADISKESSKERYFSKADAVGVLMFTLNPDVDTKSFSYSLNNTFIYLTKDYENTIKLLKDNDLYNLIDRNFEIESITLQEFNPYDSAVNSLSNPFSLYFMSYVTDSNDDFMIKKDFGNENVITDKEKIEKMRPKLKNAYYLSRGGSLACVKLKGNDRYVYMFLPEK